MIESLTVPLGFDVSGGLDGERIGHMMSPGGYHICIIGPEPERVEYRERFVRASQDAGLTDVMRISADDPHLARTMQAVVNDLRWRQGTHLTSDLPPRLVTVPADLPEEHRGYIRKLLDEGRFYGVTVLTEFERAAAPHASHATYNSKTVIYLGARSREEAQAHTGWALPDFFAEAYLTHYESGRIHPAVLL